MLRAPRKRNSRIAALAISGLLLLSQAVNAAGYFWEKHIGVKRSGGYGNAPVVTGAASPARRGKRRDSG